MSDLPDSLDDGTLEGEEALWCPTCGQPTRPMMCWAESLEDESVTILYCFPCTLRMFTRHRRARNHIYRPGCHDKRYYEPFRPEIPRPTRRSSETPPPPPPLSVSGIYLLPDGTPVRVVEIRPVRDSAGEALEAEAADEENQTPAVPQPACWRLDGEDGPLYAAMHNKLGEPLWALDWNPYNKLDMLPCDLLVDDLQREPEEPWDYSHLRRKKRR